jgi:hypothetical protein
VTTLAELAKDLEYAAGPGAARIATSVVASGDVQAKTGGVTMAVPGPALRSILDQPEARSTRQTNAVSAARVPRIADQMASNALAQGAQLLSGSK